MEHRTVRVVLPVIVASQTVGQDVLTQVDFRTEPYVNEDNATIDWFGTSGDDEYYPPPFPQRTSPSAGAA
jgi:hypothetical protein